MQYFSYNHQITIGVGFSGRLIGVLSNIEFEREQKIMNITFLIGNGFDINLGLNTRYSDFYPYFVEKSTETNMIRECMKKMNY